MDRAGERGKGKIVGAVISLSQGSKLGRSQEIEQLDGEIKGYSDQLIAHEKKMEELIRQIEELNPAEEEKELAQLRKKNTDCQSRLTRMETTLEIEKGSLEQNKESVAQVREQMKRYAEQNLGQRNEWESARLLIS